MARYIDADKFNRDLQCEYHGMISDESLKIYKIIHRIDAEPTADVVEVVRCGKCRYFKKNMCIKNNGIVSLNPHNYCSYGKRK